METVRQLSYISHSATDSRGGVPPELASIVIRSRSYNHAQHISGFLTFREGMYFQLIEGREADVEALLEKICRDPRHYNMTVLWDDTVQTGRFFTGWKLKLSSSSASCEEVGEFLRANQHRLDSLDPQTYSRLNTIFQLDLILSSQQVDLPSNDEFVDSPVRLQALPGTFSLTWDKPYAIEIFTVMLENWITPRDISEQFDISLQELHQLLTNPKVKPLIRGRRTESRQNPTPSGMAESTRPSSKSFYHSLRSFFLAARQ